MCSSAPDGLGAYAPQKWCNRPFCSSAEGAQRHGKPCHIASVCGSAVTPDAPWKDTSSYNRLSVLVCGGQRDCRGGMGGGGCTATVSCTAPATVSWCTAECNAGVRTCSVVCVHCGLCSNRAPQCATNPQRVQWSAMRPILPRQRDRETPRERAQPTRHGLCVWVGGAGLQIDPSFEYKSTGWGGGACGGAQALAGNQDHFSYLFLSTPFSLGCALARPPKPWWRVRSTLNTSAPAP